MHAPDWENLDDFFSTDEFAVDAMLYPADGPARPLKGIFDHPYQAADLGEYHADTHAPRFTCKTLDVESVCRGDGLVVAGIRYDIMSAPEDDGTGVSALRLEVS